jgi:hypothetical protein
MIAAAILSLLVAEPGVVLSVARCPAPFEAALRRVVRVELGDVLRAPASGAGTDAAADAVTVTCAGDRASLLASGPQGRLERVLSLEGWSDDARPRVVGLAATELLASLNPAVRRRLATGAVAGPGVTEDGSPQNDRSLDRGLRVLVGAEWRRFLAQGGLGPVGATLVLEQDSPVGVGAALDLDLGAARGTDPLGTIDALVGSGGLGINARRSQGPWNARLRVGARLGFARLTGRPADPGAVAGRRVLRPWGGPALAAGLGWTRGWLCTELGLELGYAALNARASGADAVSAALAGPWLSVTLAAGLRTRQDQPR